ncbi:MAG: sensor histidine kinase [Kiritimatiellae bacterium]|jgi:anti-sigma regulatory factor (Ser/Thr protein kinase)|nr:sensor histidine kinase [Kiritimatiellia bacterium]
MHASIADVIADTAQNSIEAGAKNVTVRLVEDGEYVSVSIADNGKGMDESVLRRVFDPFFTEAGKHDRRKVGLGLPILKQLCEATGGSLELKSEKGVGTVLDYRFEAKHLDLPPMGDLAGMALALFNYPGDFELEFSHRRLSEEYSVLRSELSEAVGGLDSVESLSMAREFLECQEEALKTP